MRSIRRFSALLAIAAVALTGCASQDYAQYTQARAAEARARSEADVARYNALARIAETGSDAARVAAVMSLQTAGNGQNVTTPTAPPERGRHCPGLSQRAGTGWPDSGAGATTTYDNSFNDSTHAPTVVTQPPPLVVVQPEPIVVTQPQPVVVQR